jgi:hypothetical protein
MYSVDKRAPHQCKRITNELQPVYNREGGTKTDDTIEQTYKDANLK